jgi:hypothetical protein
LVIPLIHFLLLSFLPLWRMRESRNPAYAAGCGQLFMARRSAYLKAGGHGAIRTSLHDGLTLPRLPRRRVGYGPLRRHRRRVLSHVSKRRRIVARIVQKRP